MTETETNRDADRELGLQDEDRLPWLEAVENDSEDDSVDTARVMGFIIAGLLALALVIGGVVWLRNQGPQGDGTLIAAQEGDYKVKPDQPGGMKVEGQGDSAFATSEGAEAAGKIDQRNMPETPVAATKGATPPAKTVAAAKPVVTAVVPPSSGALAPKAPAPQPGAASAAGGGGLVQFGAYGSQASAEAAWTRLTSANPTLAKLPKTIVAAAVGGNTFYRLRANAGSPANAAAVCKQVGNCIVVR
jgi:SPOR domain